MGRIANIKSRAATKREGGNVSQMGSLPTPEPIKTEQDRFSLRDTPITPGEAVGSQANKAEKITYANSGIVPTMSSGQEYRQGALGAMDENTFKKNQATMNASDKEYWKKQVQEHPDSVYATLNEMFAKDKTPAEIEREKRSQAAGEVLNNLGNLIGNIANLHYATKGGIPVDLNSVNEARRARMDKIREKNLALKEKQDALLAKAKSSDATALRDAELEKQKSQNQLKIDLYKKQIDDAYERGLIDLRHRNKLLENADKAKTDKELESVKQQNKLSLKAYDPNGTKGRVATSAKDENGSIWNRSSIISNDEKKAIVRAKIPNIDTSEYSHYNYQQMQNVVDYDAAFADLINNGKLTAKELKSMGFKQSSNNSKPKDEDIITWNRSMSGNK